MSKTSKNILTAVGALLVASAGVSFFTTPTRAAPPASPSRFRIFSNCYGLLTGKALPLDSRYLQRLKNEAISGQALCQEILTGLHLDAAGRIATSDWAANQGLARAVLARMQLVHQSWFNRMSFINSEKEFASSAVMDVQAPANYLTWTLFSDREAGQIFSVVRPPAAIRETAVPQDFMLEKDINLGTLYPRNSRKWLFQLHEVERMKTAPGALPDPDPGYDAAKDREWHPQYVAMGELLGFSDQPATRAPAAVYEIPRDGFGGGVIGTQAYFSANTGVEHDVLTDGALKMHRRWSENILKDFLCRDLPVLTEADVAANVNKAAKSPFQQQAECMKCHQTMDNLAAGARDLYISWTGFDKTHPFFARIVRQTQTKEAGPAALLRADADARYAFSPPDGQFNYRDVDGRRVSFDFKNLNELGGYLAGSKDFHYCMTKRYVKYFTGYDFDVRTKAQDSPEAGEFLRLADGFYAHRNQKRLLVEILDSPLFTRGKAL